MNTIYNFFFPIKYNNVPNDEVPNDEVPNECSICYINKKNMVKAYQCKHEYCKECIETMFQNVHQHNCPQCRANKIPINKPNCELKRIDLDGYRHFLYNTEFIYDETSDVLLEHNNIYSCYEKNYCGSLISHLKFKDNKWGFKTISHTFYFETIEEAIVKLNNYQKNILHFTQNLLNS